MRPAVSLAACHISFARNIPGVRSDGRLPAPPARSQRGGRLSDCLAQASVLRRWEGSGGEACATRCDLGSNERIA
jgi:hypothetical protein